MLHIWDGRHARQEGEVARPALLCKNDQNREAEVGQKKGHTLASFQFRSPQCP